MKELVYSIINYVFFSLNYNKYRILVLIYQIGHNSSFYLIEVLYHYKIFLFYSKDYQISMKSFQSGVNVCFFPELQFNPNTSPTYQNELEGLLLYS